MNNRGWGLQTMLLMVCVLALALIISFILLRDSFGVLFQGNSIFDNEKDKTSEVSNNEYQKLEKNLENSAKRYVDAFYKDGLVENNPIIVTVFSLVNENLLKQPVDPKNKTEACKGYVRFTLKEGKVIYEPYLKCGSNYQTKGYIDRLAKESN